MRSESTQGLNRLWLLRLLVVAVLAVLAVRLWRVQIVDGAKYRLMADRNRLREVEDAAPRGVMYDATGQILVRNRPSFSIAIVPADLPKTKENEADRAGQAAVIDRLLALLPPPEGSTAVTPAPSPTPSPTPTAAKGARATPAPAVTPEALTKLPVRKPWVMPRAELEKAVEEGQWGGAYREIVVAKFIDERTAFLIAEATADLPGVQLEPVPVRDYLSGALTGHLLGYMAPIPETDAADYKARGYLANDQVGMAGLEATYEDQLHGKSGRQTIEVDVSGRRIRTIGESIQPVPGHNLTLTIDMQLQKVATEALQEVMDKSSGFTKATQGVVVALDPRNGKVLAMVSLPSYNNNLFAKGITTEAWKLLTEDPNRPLLNQAVSGQYPPGSTFKLVPSAAGLQEGVITPQTRFTDASGIMYLPNKYFPDDSKMAQPFYCWSNKYGYGHGSITVREAIAESCDIFFYQLGGGLQDVTPGLGSARLGKYAKEFGFGAPTGIELPGEAAGLVPDEKYKRLNYQMPWTTGDTYNMSIGQGFVLATPLQVANMTAATANRGTLYRPQLVDKITDAEGKVVKPFEPIVIRQLAVDPAYLDIVREGMYGAINWNIGTAPVAQLKDVAVAGKTGTAEYFRDDNHDQQPDRDEKGNLPTHAWFTSFAPYGDPEIVVTVFIANAGEGSAVAAPVAARILRSYFGIPEPAAPVVRTKPGD
jgi:penicillin-binding protein 2